jgi:hydroxymethylpyrimidine pyrophosphatase-like HAD family hydrolase
MRRHAICLQTGILSTFHRTIHVRYLALATDYDGTLAHHGRVDDETLAGLGRLLASGRDLIMVTGRRLDELSEIFPHLNLFKSVVAENGALVYCPATQKWKTLAEPPPIEFAAALQERGIDILEMGQVILATWEPHETTVLEVIREQGLELQVTFNKGAVMVLPSGVNKASGLAAALVDMKLSPHNVVGIGDAENDHAFLSLTECAVAVENALQALKDRADFVTKGDHGRGVVELIDQIIDNDLELLEPRLSRHHLLLGADEDEGEVRIAPSESSVLISGASGSGKSTAATGLVERLMEQHYQCCIIDPEGDYSELEGAAVLGNSKRPPTIDEIVNLLDNPTEHVVANLIDLAVTERPAFFLQLLLRLQDLRVRKGRPHWIIVDEAHHMLPSQWEPGELALPRELSQVMWITVDPALLAPAVLETVQTIIAPGPEAASVYHSFANIVDERLPRLPLVEVEKGQVIYWRRGSKKGPRLVHAKPSTVQRKRHQRKYAEGELPPDRSFYFRGPEGKLKLRAQNLFVFMSLADGVDDETWLYHLRRGDYSVWFRNRIKDAELAVRAEAIERQSNPTAEESRNQIKQAIEERYTLPAQAPLPMPGTDAEGRFATSATDA